MDRTLKILSFGLCLLASATALQAEILFREDISDADRKWTWQNWEGENKEPQEGSKQEKILSINAVPAGYAGWISPMIRLSGNYPKNDDISVKFRIKLSPDYSGNTPRVFITWFKDGKFKDSLFLPVPANILLPSQLNFI